MAKANFWGLFNYTAKSDGETGSMLMLRRRITNEILALVMKLFHDFRQIYGQWELSLSPSVRINFDLYTR
jgi:hypothetical protein